MEMGEWAPSDEEGKVKRRKSEKHVPLVAVSQERRKPDDLLQLPVSRHGETGCVKFQERLQLFKEGLAGEPPDSRNVVVEHPAVERKDTTPDDMRVSSDEESTDLPTIANKSKRPNTSERAQSVYTVSQKIRIVKFVSSRQLPERNRPEARGDRCHHPQMFGDATTADHKVVSKEIESLVCIIVTQLWCGTFILFGYIATQRRTKLRNQR